MAHLKPEEVRHRSTKLGYIVLYSENWEKCEYEHRFVMEQHLGRRLSRNEIVHHKDHDRANNDISNLEIMSNAEHGMAHAIENGFEIRATKRCADCGKHIYRSAKRCPECAQNKRRIVKDRPPYEQLIAEVEETSFVAVGKKYGVSDNTIRKWIRRYESEAAAATA